MTCSSNNQAQWCVKVGNILLQLLWLLMVLYRFGSSIDISKMDDDISRNLTALNGLINPPWLWRDWAAPGKSKIRWPNDTGSFLAGWIRMYHHIRHQPEEFHFHATCPSAQETRGLMHNRFLANSRRWTVVLFPPNNQCKRCMRHSKIYPTLVLHDIM